MKADFTQWNKLIKKIENNRVAKKNALVYIGVQAENTYGAQIKKIAATGELGRSVSFDIRNDRVTVGPEASYARSALETGTQPGTQVSVESLKVWARKKGIPQGAVFAIKKTIEKSGTRKYRNKRPKQLTDIKSDITSNLNKYAKYLLSELFK